jgi:2-polyprenyl-3-methyl-5-hydroxy-6-metoxy-1,4-benzoquinol methylase
MLNNGVCNICDHPGSFESAAETSSVRSNVRAFRDETFTVWRCSACRSIHARDEVDLDHYYAQYPFHKQKDDWRLQFVYRAFRARLARAGLRSDSSILDYGCGSGLLVKYLGRFGFKNVAGYDSFNPSFSDPAIINRKYDCIVAQDLVEHVHDGPAMLKTFSELVRPGGIILIGTPNADAICLNPPDDNLHALHQPFHTHIFSKDALVTAGQALGWSVDHLYMTNYTNTLIPCLNLNFGFHYAKCFDNTVDLAFETPRFNRKLINLRTIYLAFFGYFRAPETDITVVFRAPG